MKKILITGALGHIGSKLIHEIKPNDFGKVILLDNLSTQRYCSLFNLPDNVPFQFIEGDVLQDNLEQYFEGVDVVVHLAAITNAAGSFEIQDQVEKVNYEGTKKVAEACQKFGCSLIFLSSTSVYGTQEALVDEDCSKEELKPQSPYAESKLKSEEFLKKMGTETGLKYVVFRFGTIFGTSIGMRFHTAVNKFVWQACMGIPLTVWRTALNQKRPYLDIVDATRALRFAIEKNIFDDNIYNVLSTNTTVSEIVEIIRSDIPDVSIKLVDEQIMNQLSYEVSCEKFKKLNFRFEGDMRRGIKDTISLLKNCRTIS